MLRVALTGGIASGKSYVLAHIASRDVPTIDADALVHEAMGAGSPLVARIAARFGRRIVARDGSVDRKALGRLVFADAPARADLEALLHPEVFRRIDQWFVSLAGGTPGGRDSGRTGPAGAASPPAPFAVADIPLLFETRHDGLFDRVVVTICTPEKQVERMIERDGLTRDEALSRLQAQWPIEEKARLAHYTIDTNGSFEETNRQIEHVLAELRQDAT